MFNLFSLFFHCGQIIKMAFNIEGTVPIPFENYASDESIQMAFWFYLLSQTFFMMAVGISSNIRNNKVKTSFLAKVNTTQVISVAKYLIIIGLAPRLYIDLVSLFGAVATGYEGVYSLYIPQPVQSLGFFFDAGIILLLFGWSNQKNKDKWLFIFGLLYKGIMMTSGGRQDKVAFLLIWIYIYYFVIQKITVRKSLLIGLMGLFGFSFISAIGAIRTLGSFNLVDILTFLISGDMNHTIGNALGEFGSAFDTLEVAVEYTPVTIPYGYGKSYIAGMISIIPLLVKQIPFLDEATIFLHQLPENIWFAFGGSYLGELYFNFSWFGIFGSAVIGYIVGKVDRELMREAETTRLQKGWAAIIAIALILFVRGYFTDMVQKLAWTYIFLFVFYSQKRKKSVSYDKHYSSYL